MKFQTIQFSINIVFVYKQLNVKINQLNVKTVLFQTTQFSISTPFSSHWPIDRTLSRATTLSQGGPGSDGYKEVLCIPQSSSNTGATPSDCLVSYPGNSLGESYPSADVQSVYSIAPADRAIRFYNYEVCIYPTFRPRTGCGSRSMSKWGKTGLSSVFLFLDWLLTKAKEPSLPYYLTNSWRQKNWIHAFPKGISSKWNTESLAQDLNSVR